MANNDDERLLWMATQVEEGLFNAYMDLGTEDGIHPKYVIKAAMEEYLVKRARDKKKPVGKASIQLQAAEIMYRQRIRNVGTLKKLAHEYLEDPTEEGAEELERLCKAAGRTMETLIEGLNHNEQIAELIQENGSISNLEMWLLEYMQPNKLYQADSVKQDAQEAGFSVYTLGETKRRLGIPSIRKGKKWYWALPEPQEQP